MLLHCIIKDELCETFLVSKNYVYTSFFRHISLSVGLMLSLVCTVYYNNKSWFLLVVVVISLEVLLAQIMGFKDNKYTHR